MAKIEELREELVVLSNANVFEKTDALGEVLRVSFEVLEDFEERISALEARHGS